MINRVQSNTNFGSTRIKLLPIERQQAVSKVLDKYLSPLQRPNIKGGLQGKGVTPQMVSDDIVNSDVACTITSRGQDMFVNVFGKGGKVDGEFGKLLTDKFENARFSADIK